MLHTWPTQFYVGPPTSTFLATLVLYRVAKPLLICGYHGLTIVTMVLVLFLVKPWLIFLRVVLSAITPPKPVIKLCEYLSVKFLLFTIVIMSFC